MTNFYEFLKSDFNINPKDSVKETIVKATMYNLKSSIDELNSTKENQVKERIGAKISTENENETKYDNNVNAGSLQSKFKNKKNNSVANLRSITMKDYLENQKLFMKPDKIDFLNPNSVIKVVEQEFKNVKIIPKTVSFITQQGEFKDFKVRNKSFEEAIHRDLNSSYKEQESKKKKKFLEYTLVII